MNPLKQNKKIAVIILASILIFSFIVIGAQINSRRQINRLQKQTEKQNILLKKAIAKNQKKREVKREKSIISFFLTQPLGASLAIFSDWEGHYRLDENGNRADFVFLEPKAKKQPIIFSILNFKKNKWDQLKNSDDFKNTQILKEVEGVVFIALIPNSSINNPQFAKMRDDVDKILPTLRIFKLK